MLLGLALLGAFVYGPERLGLNSACQTDECDPFEGRLVPTGLANLTIANFPLFVVGAFGVGALLVAAAGLKIRSEQARVAAA